MNALARLFVPFLLLVVPLAAQRGGFNASGGVLRPTQAAYDVTHYRLQLTVDDAERTIDGTLTMTAKVLAAIEAVDLDLDAALTVHGATVGGVEAKVVRDGGRFDVQLPEPAKVGAEVVVAVRYGGKPRVAPMPPWRGGFTWSKTKSGAPWIATSCQGEGADLWWPCKDHPSDECDSMDLVITVREDLFCATNGKLVKIDAGEKTRTFHWHVSTPINNYGVALNIAPYVQLEHDYESVDGTKMKVLFWVLPESEAKGKAALPHFVAHLNWFERTYGPYPFRGDKYGIVETPHLGMEHQTIIAYGNRFQLDADGYDWLHHHELAHEWWANLVTCRDWKDMWIHEGIGTYTQALYLEELRGKDAYHAQIAEWRRSLSNRRAIAPRESQNSQQIYFGGGGGNDLYNKGAVVMHTLRWVLGDEKFTLAMRRMAYPDPALEKTTDGSACRSTDSDEFRAIVEKHGGMPLQWFCDVYLHEGPLPRLHAEEKDGALHLRWEAPKGLPFPMPVPVEIGGETKRIEMPDGTAVVPLDGKTFRVDPQQWVLRRTR